MFERKGVRGRTPGTVVSLQVSWPPNTSVQLLRGDNVTALGQIIQITIYLCTVDHLVPRLPLCEVVQDSQTTNPTPGNCPTAVDGADFYGSHPAKRARSYTWYTRSGIDDISALKDLDHGLWE